MGKLEGNTLFTSHRATHGHRFFSLALATLLVIGVVGVIGTSAAHAVEQSATIDFESGLSEGDTPETLSVGHGMTGDDLGTVTLIGFNPDVPGNSAMIYDSTCGGQTVPPGDPAFDPALCSDDDPDLYVPAAGNIAIISEDGNAAVPDDAARDDTTWTFDFTDWGTGAVTVDSFGVADVDFGQTEAEATFFDAAGAVLGVISIPEIGDNAAAVVTAGIADVATMRIALNGSGGIDLISISTDIPLIDLELTKDVDPGEVQVGEETTFTVSVINQGPDAATGVTVTDTLPAGLTYVSDTAGGAFDPTTGVWTIGDLAVGESVSMALTVTVDEVGTFTNIAEVTTANEEDIDSTPGNGTDNDEDDWDDATVVATPEPPTSPDPIIDVELTKDVDPSEVTVGEETTFTVTVVNQGPDDATGVVVTDTLPAGLTYVSNTAGGAFDPATFIWTIGDVAVGESVSMDFIVTVDDIGIFTNVAEVTAHNEEDIDSTPGNGTDNDEDDWDDATVTAVAIVEASSTIGDFVWFDDNKDQVQDPDEGPVPGVTVRLTNQATNEVLTQVTNADGKYLFSGLDAGTYLVEVLTSTFPDNHGLTTVGSYTVTVLDDESFLDADFGIVAILPVTGMEVESVALIGLMLLGLGGLLLGLEQGRRRLGQAPAI
ncbi:MAG: SdrD B-like domain-containing protein [Actinomycetota bacterium]|nr:SdrD B-like domain-containing protein [Actinomycetota bacterium]